ncbi:CDP-alcohol phosphatidyltransferase family protein [Streptococcus iniae]
MTKKENIPNLLTMLRIIMIPIFLMITSFLKKEVGILQLHLSLL